MNRIAELYTWKTNPAACNALEMADQTFIESEDVYRDKFTMRELADIAQTAAENYENLHVEYYAEGYDYDGRTEIFYWDELNADKMAEIVDAVNEHVYSQ